MRLSITQMAAFGKKIGTQVTAGVPLLLFGPMGAGKTTLARSIITALCPHVAFIPSPSFPIMLPYGTGTGSIIWHVDLYRLEDPREIHALGLLEVMAEHICIIEWPERLGTLCPRHTMVCTLAFSRDEGYRDVTTDVTTQ